MGMYTRFVLNVALDPECPGTVIEVLEYMLGKREVVTLPDHPLFQTERWRFMLRSTSYYHDAIGVRQMTHDSISNCTQLSVVCDLKNYQGEIALFCDWLAPHVETRDLAGYSRYEEDLLPRLLWFRDGKAMWHRLTQLPEFAEADK